MKHNTRFVSKLCCCTHFENTRTALLFFLGSFFPLLCISLGLGLVCFCRCCVVLVCWSLGTWRWNCESVDNHQNKRQPDSCRRNQQVAAFLRSGVGLAAISFQNNHQETNTEETAEKTGCVVVTCASNSSSKFR